MYLRSCFSGCFCAGRRRSQKGAEVLRGSQTRIVIRPTVDDLAFLRHVLFARPERVLEEAEASVEHRAYLVVLSAYELGHQLPHSGELASREARVRAANFTCTNLLAFRRSFR